jgi:hypothetical protein
LGCPVSHYAAALLLLGRWPYIDGMLWRSSRGRPLNAPAAFKLIVAISLIAAVPVCAQAQNSRVSKDDAQRVVTIISGDKTKTQAYCDILKLTQQIAQAYEKNDGKMVDELSQKTDTLEKNPRSRISRTGRWASGH